MIRGTTAQFRFKLPYPKNEFQWINVAFWQDNNPNELLPIIKTKDQCAYLNSEAGMCVSLTSEETLRFSDKYKAKFQVRALHTASGTVFGSRQALIPVYPMNGNTGDQDPTLPDTSMDVLIVLDGKGIIAGDDDDDLTILDGQQIVSEDASRFVVLDGKGIVSR